MHPRRDTGCPTAASDCAISSSWWELVVVAAGVDVEALAECFIDIAEHSMCHPG